MAGPGLRLVAPRGGAQTGQVRSGQVLLTIYWNPVLIRYDYFELFQEKKEKNHLFQTIRVAQGTRLIKTFLYAISSVSICQTYPPDIIS